MIIGFTGTRDGMSPRQKRQFENIILLLRPTEFNHGDCIGADDEAVDIIWRLRQGTDIFHPIRCRIVAHPPVDGKYQARNPHSDYHHPDAPYLVRNAEIAYSCDILIAAPKEKKEQTRRGTWHTIRKAWEMGKTTIILSP